MRRVLGLLVLMACSGGSDEPVPDDTGVDTGEDSPWVSPPEPGSLTWDEGCGLSLKVNCSTLEVPIDHQDATRGMVDVPIALWPARGEKRGTMLLNFGGPGIGPVSANAENMIRKVIPASVREVYDVVVWAPRGTQGDVLNCGIHVDPFFGFDYSPDTTEELQATLGVLQDIGETCATSATPLYGYTAPEDVARDMDWIRHVLGEDQISYVGYSYGGVYGAVYADLFPGRVDRWVLDAAMSPAISMIDFSRGQGDQHAAFVRGALERCSENPECSFYKDGNSVQAYFDLLEQLDTAPLEGHSRPVGELDLLAALTNAAYAATSQENYDGRVLQTLDLADRGDAVGLASLVGADGEFDEIHLMMGCNHGPNLAPEDVLSGYEAEADRHEFSGMFYAMRALCAWMPDPVYGEGIARAAEGAGPIVVTTGPQDFAVPRDQTEQLDSELADSVLLIGERWGHWQYGVNLDDADPCIQDAITGYLLEGTVPEDHACDVP